MRLCASRRHSGRPICSAWKPKMSATVRSKYACSRSMRYSPSGVASQAAIGIELSAILASHHHADHVGGSPALRERYDVPVFGPAHEPIPARTHPLGEGDRIGVPGVDLLLSVFDIPGHTRGHIAYYTMPPDPLVH